MNTQTLNRPTDVNAARLARKLRSRGIDPTKVAKPADVVPTAKAEAPSLAEQDAELERMLREECGDQSPVNPEVPAEAIIGDEAVTDAPIAEPETSEKENSSDTPILETATAEVRAAETAIVTQPVSYEPNPKPAPAKKSGIVSAGSGLGAVVDDTFADLVRKFGKRNGDVVTFVVNDLGTQKPVHFTIRDPHILRRCTDLAGTWVLIRGLVSHGDGIRRIALDVKPKDVPITGILRANRWPAQNHVAFEWDLAKNGTYHVNVTQLNTGLHVRVAHVEYMSENNKLVRMSTQHDEMKNDTKEESEAPAEPKPAPQPEKQAQATQDHQHNGDQRDHKVTPPSFKAKAERPKQSKKHDTKNPVKNALLKAFPGLEFKSGDEVNKLVATDPLDPMRTAAETFRVLAEMEDAKQDLLSEATRIDMLVTEIMSALNAIVRANKAAFEDSTIKLVLVEGKTLPHVRLDPATDSIAKHERARILLTKLGMDYPEYNGQDHERHPFFQVRPYYDTFSQEEEAGIFG